MLYEESRTMLFFADDITVGRIMKAAFSYFNDHKDPPESASFTAVEKIAYERLKKDADKTWADYNNIRKINSAKGKKGGRPRKTAPLTEEQIFENNRTAKLNSFREYIASEKAAALNS